jgi:hypothetical protein
VTDIADVRKRKSSPEEEELGLGDYVIVLEVNSVNGSREFVLNFSREVALKLGMALIQLAADIKE